MQNRLEQDLENIEAIQTQSLLRYVSDYRTKVIRYTDSKEIIKVLDTTKPASPDDIELIAKSLVVEDVDRITVYDLLLYDQIITAFRKANSMELQNKSIEECARKIRNMSLNAKSVEFLLNMKLKENSVNEDKMQGIEITKISKDAKAEGSKRRRQQLEEEEKEGKEEETSEKKEKAFNKTKSQERKNLQTENLEKQLQYKVETNVLLEHSSQASTNRGCSNNSSYKTQIPISNLKGNTVQERLHYIKTVLGENKHIKSVEEKAAKENK